MSNVSEMIDDICEQTGIPEKLFLNISLEELEIMYGMTVFNKVMFMSKEIHKYFVCQYAEWEIENAKRNLIKYANRYTRNRRKIVRAEYVIETIIKEGSIKYKLENANRRYEHLKRNYNEGLREKEKYKSVISAIKGKYTVDEQTLFIIAKKAGIEGDTPQKILNQISICRIP